MVYFKGYKRKKMSVESEKKLAEDMLLQLANDAICADTDSVLMDSTDIEKRLVAVNQNDTPENRSSLIMGLLFYNEAILVGTETSWKSRKLTQNGMCGYAVYTSAEKLPEYVRMSKVYFDAPFGYILGELQKEKDDVNIYLNPGDVNGVTFSLQLLRLMKEIADKAVDFADGLLKRGLEEKDLTDTLFERFDFRQVHIKLKDGREIEGEVTGLSYGDDPNAKYEVTQKSGEPITVYRRDISYIREIDETES